MKKAMKRSRHNGDVSTVVNAIVCSDSLPENLRHLLQVTMPIVLDATKVDRHGFEAEVVDQAQQGLKAVQVGMELAHKAALATQDEVTSNAERAKRVKAVSDAEAHLEAMKSRGENDKAARNAADQALHQAEDALKVAQKEDKSLEKELQRYVDKKAHVSNVLANEFVLLRNGTSGGAGGRKAVNNLVAVGKEYGLDSTILQTLPITCKKPAANYTEFETMMFTNLQGLMDRVIAGLVQNIAELEAVKAARSAAVAAATETLANAKAALTTASVAWDNQQKATSAASRAVHQADAHRRNLWEEMRHLCDAADGAAKELATLQERVWAAFKKLKEKEAEPEPVEEPEPVAETAPEAAPQAAAPAPEVATPAEDA